MCIRDRGYTDNEMTEMLVNSIKMLTDDKLNIQRLGTRTVYDRIDILHKYFGFTPKQLKHIVHERWECDTEHGYITTSEDLSSVEVKDD